MVIGGFRTTYEVDVVDLSGQNLTCSKPANYPIASGSVAAFVNGSVIVCGGCYNDTSDRTKDCYAYNNLEDNWALAYSMLEPRYFASGVLLSDTQWWIVGGGAYPNVHNSTELLTSGTGFVSYTFLPKRDDVTGDIVRVNASHFIYVTGKRLWSPSPLPHSSHTLRPAWSYCQL